MIIQDFERLLGPIWSTISLGTSRCTLVPWQSSWASPTEAGDPRIVLFWLMLEKDNIGGAKHSGAVFLLLVQEKPATEDLQCLWRICRSMSYSGPLKQIPGSDAGEPEFSHNSSSWFLGMLKFESYSSGAWWLITLCPQKVPRNSGPAYNKEQSSFLLGHLHHLYNTNYNHNTPGKMYY